MPNIPGHKLILRLLLAAAAFWLLAACRPAPAPAPTTPPTATPPPAATEISRAATPTPRPSSTPRPEPATVTPIPTVTATPQPTSTTIPTATPTPSPTPTHPLMIEVMREQSYPGSELIFEETLEPGDNYDRYIVSYLSEGNKIYALLTIPQGDPPAGGWPIIIFNHGYIAPSEYRTTERYVAYVDGFARSGYIVFRSDYRGHGSSEGVANGGYGTPDYTVDVLNGMASVRRLAVADPGRVGMWGHSMGGQITLRAMVVSPDIKAGVIWAGVVAAYPDLLAAWRRDNNELTPTPDPTRQARRWSQQLYDTYGRPEENPQFWAAISPNSYLTDLSGPIQLHHGTSDIVVPLAFSELLYAEMQAAGMPAELFLYEGDNHNIANNLDLALQRSITFFDTYVR